MIVAVLGTALNDSGIAIAGVMLGVMTPVLVVVTMRGDRARPRWAISPTAQSDPPEPGSARARAGTGASAYMIVILGLVVGLLTVRFLVLGGRDVLEAPVLQRRNFRNRVLPTAAGLFVVIAALDHRSRAAARWVRSASATSPVATSHVRSCCSRASASDCSA